MAAEIVSTSNQRVKRLVRLRDRRHRDDEGVFVVDGSRAISRASVAGLEIKELYHVEEAPPFAAVSSFSCSPEVMEKISYRSETDQIVAVFDQFDTSLGSIVVGSDGLVLIAEGLEKPGNLGAVLRTADAVGADGVIAADSRVDVFNPNVIRSSTGTLFTVPIAQAGLSVIGSWLARHEVTVIAASPDAGTSLWDIDLTGSAALVVGTEDRGLSPEATAMADHLVRIPMRGTADSLNTSVAMAVLAYEALRQRNP